MNILKLFLIIIACLLLSACATPHKDVASLDIKIADITSGDFGQFLHHQALAEENLAKLRKIRELWKSDLYWNIELDPTAKAAAAKAAEHTKLAEEALERWHDGCSRHKELCQKVGHLEALHYKHRLPVAYFDTGKWEVKKVNQEHLGALLELGKSDTNLSLDLYGYTDTVGTGKANLDLAKHRAHAVKEYLLSKGLAKTVKIHEVAEGEAGGPNNVANGENRRVDVHIHHANHEEGHAHQHHGEESDHGYHHHP